jgi:hypothetical protein
VLPESRPIDFVDECSFSCKEFDELDEANRRIISQISRMCTPRVHLES